MAGRQRYSQREVIEAIGHCRGLVTLAARQLGCERTTVENYCVRYPRVRAALMEARELQLDRAEARLFQAIDQGEMVPIMFFLRTIGRNRGYSERHEVAVDGELGIRPEVADLRSLLMEALGPFPEARAAVAAALLEAAEHVSRSSNGHVH